MGNRRLGLRWVTTQPLRPSVTSNSNVQVGKLVQQPRRVKAIEGTAISVDVPLTDAIDSTYMTGMLVAYTPPAQPSEMGFENLSVKVSPTCSGRILSDNSCS